MKYTYYLDENKHSHIVHWLRTQKNITEATRKALEFYIQHQAETGRENLAGQGVDQQVISEAITGSLIQPEFFSKIRKVVELAVKEALGNVQLKTSPKEGTRDDEISYLDEAGGKFFME